jgi:hypothetical protein
MVVPVRKRTLRFDSAGRDSASVQETAFQLQAGGNKPGHSGRLPNGRPHRSGEVVRQSGIYEVVHDHTHREAHEVVMISGEHFPDCETCKDKVRFRLIRTAPYIFQDEDFEEEG